MFWFILILEFVAAKPVDEASTPSPNQIEEYLIKEYKIQLPVDQLQDLIKNIQVCTGAKLNFRIIQSYSVCLDYSDYEDYSGGCEESTPDVQCEQTNEEIIQICEVRVFQ